MHVHTSVYMAQKLPRHPRKPQDIVPERTGRPWENREDREAAPGIPFENVPQRTRKPLLVAPQKIGKPQETCTTEDREALLKCTAEDRENPGKCTADKQEDHKKFMEKVGPQACTAEELAL